MSQHGEGQRDPGARFRTAIAEEKPLQVAGAITAYAAPDGGGGRLSCALSFGRRRCCKFARRLYGRTLPSLASRRTTLASLDEGVAGQPEAEFRANPGRRFPATQEARILEASLDQTRLASIPVHGYVDLYVI